MENVNIVLRGDEMTCQRGIMQIVFSSKLDNRVALRSIAKAISARLRAYGGEFPKIQAV